MKVQEIVVPDTLKDMNETIAKALAFTRFTREGYRYMLVAQGRDASEMITCIENFASDSKFMYATTIGIPRHINDDDRYNRLKIAEYIMKSDLNRSLEFHFLGANDPFDEVKLLAATQVGRGIDTSAPLYMGRWGMQLREDHGYRPRPKDFFKIARVNTGTTEQNILTYLEWALYDRTADLPERPA